MDTNGIRGLATGVRDALRAEVSARLDAALAEGMRRVRSGCRKRSPWMSIHMAAPDRVAFA